MRADRAWIQRNLGFDPRNEPPPLTTFAIGPAKTVEDFQREIIDFDSESPVGLQFMSFTTATGLSRFNEIPWPKNLAPKTGPKPRGDGSGPLPRADVLVVTWTVDEGHELESDRRFGIEIDDLALEIVHRLRRPDGEGRGRRRLVPRIEAQIALNPRAVGSHAVPPVMNVSFHRALGRHRA